MNYQEFIEEGTNLIKLQSGFINHEDYNTTHKNSVVVCHDVFIKYDDGTKKGFLLIKRNKEPAKGYYYPVGGRMLRGLSCKESLEKKVKEECSLTLSAVTHIDVARTMFQQDPFGHGKGTDTLNLIFIANGEGTLSLDGNHGAYCIVDKETLPVVGEQLDDYVKAIFKKIDSNNLW
jgi:ADP-ribose pyrophosphatase YjhB (NUDIX family)